MAITLLTKWKLAQGISADPGVKPASVEVALRLLHHLNTKTMQCNPSNSTIADAIGLSRDTVVNSVQCLESSGWIRVIRSVERGKKAAKGQHLPSNSFEFNLSKLTQSEKTTTPSRKSRPPRSEKPTTPVDNSDHPQSKRPTTGSRKSRPKYGKEETGKRETGNGSRLAGERFEQFWMQYPKRVSKGSARKAFDRALLKASLEQIMAGVHRYAAERTGQDPKYTKHPSTWLANDCWLDEQQHPIAPAPVSRVDSAIQGLFSRSGCQMQSRAASAVTGLLGGLAPEDFTPPTTKG